MRGRADLLDWLGLKSIPGVGSVSFARMVERFGSPGGALGAPLDELMAVPRMRRDVAEAVHRRAWSRPPEEQLARLDEIGGRVVLLGDEGYPPLLARSFAPPPVLFVRGDLGGCLGGGVGMVGSRNMTDYGRRMAEDLAAGLALAGVSVVSGLARGIDGVAHRAALAHGGHTVGVLGCGLDVVYPPEHRGLVKEMARHGAVISEFPLGTPPGAANFPVRNRVIAGLCTAVIVVEAGLRSGALITARHALEENREVFAVPGEAGSQTSRGCNDLIRRNAAQLAESVADILAPGALPPDPRPLRAAAHQASLALAPPERELLAHLGDKPVHIDELGRASGLSAQEAAHFLLNLEMMDLVRQLPGKRYELV